MIEKNSTHQFNQSYHEILDLSWFLQDLQLYDNQSNPFMASMFTIIAGKATYSRGDVRTGSTGAIAPVDFGIFNEILKMWQVLAEFMAYV